MTNKHTIRMVACAAMLLSSLAMMPNTAEAKGGKTYGTGKFGLGLGVGTLATGLSGKYFLSGEGALQFNVGVHTDGRRNSWGDEIALGGDYLFEMPRLVEKGDFEVGWNIGPGIGLAFTDYGWWVASASLVLGLEFVLNVIPLDIVVEFRPSFFIFDNDYCWYNRCSGTRFDPVEFGAHLRFYF